MRKMITEEELIKLLPSWGAYSLEVGDDPKDWLLAVEYDEDDGVIYIKDVTAYTNWSGPPHTLAEYKPTDEEFSILLQFLKENNH